MSNIRPRTCRQCGIAFEGGPRAWYCPQCRERRYRERTAAYRKNGFRRHLGSIDSCVRCGKEYIVKSGQQRYCSECSKEAVMEIDKEQGLEWYYKNAASYNPVRKERRRKKTEICVVCGREFASQGTSRKICSEECHKIRKREWQHRADEKRKGNR